MAGLTPAQLDAMATKPAVSPPHSGGGLSPDELDAMAKGQPPTGNGVLGKVKQIGTGVGKALDAQRWAAAKLATGESDTDRQMTKEREMVGTQGAYEALGKIPGVGHFLQGTSDVIQQTVTDPLTYETLGAGPALRALGIAGKIGPAALKAIDATPVGRKLYDFTHWGGEVEREHPGTDVFLRGAANKASSTGKSVQDRMVYYFDQATKPLSDGDRVTVGQALNGEVSAEDLNSTQRRAFNQLRRLTEYDYAQRAAVAQKINFTALTKDMPVADRAELWKHLQANTEPKIPNPERIPKPRGPGSEVKYRSAVPGKQPGPEINWLAVYKQAFDGLSDTERRAVQDAAGRGYVEEGLAPELVDRLRVLKKAGEADLEDVKQGFGDVPKISPKRPYTLPYKNQAAIDRAKALNEKYWDVKRHVEESIPRRENYMPWTHTAQELAENKGTKAAEFNPIERTDPRTEERKEVKVDAPEQLKAGFDAMSANTGRQVQRGVLHDALGDFVDDPKIKELFKQTLKATGDERADTQKITDAWLNLVGYPRAATVSLTPRHAANILDLAMNTVPLDKQPKFFADTMALAKKIVSANPREYARLTQEGRDLGAISGSFTERKPFFQKFADWMPGIGGKSTGALGAYTRLNNKLVWAVDEAAKTQYAKILKEIHPELGDLEAGGTASKRLVDYEHVSPMVKALRYVAPFGTFRGSIPGAVAGGIARNPARAAFLNRATGGTMYGGKPDKKQHGIELYNPTADVSRGLDAPQDYLRSTIGAPVQAAATLGAEAMTGNPGASVKESIQELGAIPGQVARGQFSKIGTEPKQSPYAKAVAERAARYLNYGNPIDLRWLLGAASAGVAEARTALQQLGYSQFSAPKGPIPERAAKEAAQQVLGVGIK